MIPFEQIDFMARGGAISLLVLWSWLLVRDHSHDFPARLAVAMCAAICCYLIVTAGWYTQTSFVGLIFAMGAAATPGLFWLFARAWFNDERHVRWPTLLLVTVPVVNALVLQLSGYPDSIGYIVTRVLFRIFMFGFAIAAFWEVWRGREGDLIEGRRRLRPILVGTVATYVFLITCAEIATQLELVDIWVRRIMGTGAVFVILGFCAAMFRIRQADLFGPSAPVVKVAAPRAEPADDALVAKLLAHMACEMPHRDEGLSIAALGAQLGEQEYRLRRTINQAMGYRNFAAFLNSYRLAEVKAALADPAQRDVPIITIALDAGFGSLGPFNRAFREVEGMTPSEFRARAVG